MKDLFSKATEVNIEACFNVVHIKKMAEEYLERKTGFNIPVYLDFEDFQENRVAYFGVMEWELEQEALDALDSAGFPELSVGAVTPGLMSDMFGSEVETCLFSPYTNDPVDIDENVLMISIKMPLETYRTMVKDKVNKALGKQVAIKLISKPGRYSGHYLCPTCNRMYWKDEAVPNYCQSCGQKFELN